MENKPKLTISGYRGIWGESLTSNITKNYTRAYIKFVKENIKNNPTILIGRDGRESGPEIRDAVINIFKEENISFIDGDILPTPTVLFAVKKHEYDGAIIITASHNPREYNGLKFITNKALFTNEDEVKKIIKNYNEIVNQNIKFEETTEVSNILHIENQSPSPLIKEYIDKIIENTDVEIIKAKKWKIAVDMINAAACVVDPLLFERLGIELVPLNDIPNGIFGHKPEPLRENLQEIARVVREKECDLGFAHDPDADRLVVINEQGEVVFEEYTLALGAEAIMSKSESKGGSVVINMSTSQTSKDIAEKYGGKCIRTKVGEANVVEGIINNNAVMGGEGGGAIIYPIMNMARDSFVSLVVILELLAKRNQTVSECIDSLPKYEMQKIKIVFEGEMEPLYVALKNEFGDANNVNTLDGIRFDWNDSSWLHIRRSNTEPKMWIISEAKTKERIDELFEKAKLIINNIK